MKLIQKYGKKKVYIGSAILIVACIAIGISSWYIMEQNYKQKILDSIGITFIEDASIEYGTEKVDYNALIKEKTGEPEVLLPTEEMNTKEQGKKQVTYVLSKDGYSKNQDLEIEIKDTIAPEIVFKEDVITLEYESDYDIKENIESVKDPIDGDIPYAESAGENNYYIVDGTIDSSTAGEYIITVKAVDKNNVSNEKAFSVIVNEKEEVQEPKQSQSGGNKTPVSNNGANSNNDGTSSENTVEEPHYRTDISNTYAAQINAYRQENGLVELSITNEAQSEANRRAMELVTYYSHDGCGAGFTENIGMGDVNYNFFIGWKNSPTHDGTMLRNNDYNGFAVAVVEYQNKWYAVTSFKVFY